MMERSRAPMRENCNVRGIGVGGKGECIHVHPELFHLLFCSNAKLLLLIDDQQAQFFEFMSLLKCDVFDDDVDLS